MVNSLINATVCLPDSYPTLRIMVYDYENIKVVFKL